ncbi:MAG: hypothetical protein Q9179_000011 [Wetmoreana sp. 5 TL-2023]
MPALPSLRFPGDGLDFRRPALTPVSNNVIDLTDDNTPLAVQPQFRPNPRVRSSIESQSNNTRRVAADLIDVDEESTGASIDSSSRSPDLELIGVRSIRSQPTSDTEPRRTHGTRPERPPANLRPPGLSHHSHTEEHPFTVGGWNALRQHAQGRESQQRVARQTARHFHHLLHLDHPMPPALLHGGQEILLPGDLDFVAQGFQMGDVRQTQPALPTYEAPSPPRSGFTRSPKEEDALVCPNCAEELGVGIDESKRQVWVIKACGHVRSTVVSVPKTVRPINERKSPVQPQRSRSLDALWKVAPSPSQQRNQFSKSISSTTAGRRRVP